MGVFGRTSEPPRSRGLQVPACAAILPASDPSEEIMHTRNLRPLAAGFFLILGAVACGGDDTTTDSSTTDSGATGDVTYADVQAIWDASCGGSGCHTNGGTSGALALDAGSSRDNLVGVASIGAAMDLVTAGSADDSYLWHKLLGTQSDVGGSGSDMPLGSTLSASELGTIETWIDGGASAD